MGENSIHYSLHSLATARYASADDGVPEWADAYFYDDAGQPFKKFFSRPAPAAPASQGGGYHDRGHHPRDNFSPRVRTADASYDGRITFYDGHFERSPSPDENYRSRSPLRP